MIKNTFKEEFSWLSQYLSEAIYSPRDVMEMGQELGIFTEESGGYKQKITMTPSGELRSFVCNIIKDS